MTIASADVQLDPNDIRASAAMVSIRLLDENPAARDAGEKALEFRCFAADEILDGITDRDILEGRFDR